MNENLHERHLEGSRCRTVVASCGRYNGDDTSEKTRVCERATGRFLRCQHVERSHGNEDASRTCDMRIHGDGLER